MIIKKFIKSKPVVDVTFQLPREVQANKAVVAGEFNNWDTTANPMHKSRGVWKTTLKLATGREYQFRYMVNDSEWHNDDAADSYVSNNLGGINSVISAPPLPTEQTRKPRSSKKSVRNGNSIIRSL